MTDATRLADDNLVLVHADPDRARQVLALLPTPLRSVHRLVWQPRYRRAARWA